MGHKDSIKCGKGGRAVSYVTAKDVQNNFNLRLSAGSAGIERQIHTSDISRPGLEMAGYFNHYPSDRVQLLGKTELSFFAMLQDHERVDRMDRLCSTDTPVVILHMAWMCRLNCPCCRKAKYTSIQRRMSQLLDFREC